MKKNATPNPLQCKKTSTTKELSNNFKDKKTYSGETTISTVRRIRIAVQCLNQISEWHEVFNKSSGRAMSVRLTFMTLTISSKTIYDHDLCYQKLLKPFLQWLTKTKNVKHYIWKAELQKRGQVHYHITTNQYIYWKEIREKWNYLQDKNGFLDDYKKRYKKNDPNSIDVHKVYNDNNIAAYLEKYISKRQTDGQVLNSKIWDCSKSLKGRKLFSTSLSPQHLNNISNVPDTKIKSFITADNYTIVQFENDKISAQILYGYEHKLYQEWKDNIINSGRRKATLIIPDKKKQKKKKLIINQSLY